MCAYSAWSFRKRAVLIESQRNYHATVFLVCCCTHEALPSHPAHRVIFIRCAVQVVLQAEIKKRTDAGDYMGMFSLMKDQANVIKQAMNEENQRYGVVVLRFGLSSWCLFLRILRVGLACAEDLLYYESGSMHFRRL